MCLAHVQIQQLAVLIWSTFSSNFRFKLGSADTIFNPFIPLYMLLIFFFVDTKLSLFAITKGSYGISRDNRSSDFS